MILKFVDREKELEELEKRHGSGKPELIIMYGRRRVGKTEIIKKFIDGKTGLYFLAKQEDMDIEFNRFKEKLASKLNIFLGGRSWEELFNEVADKTKGRLIIVIDEFPYWIIEDGRITSEIQYVWDEILSKKNIMLVLLGSYVSIMEQKVLGHKTPLYGRRTSQMEIKPLGIKCLKEFFPRYDARCAIEAYGALGTIPYYLNQFDDAKDFWQNVRDTFLNTSNILYADAEILLSAEVREYNKYFNVMKSIIGGAVKLNEIANAAKIDITNVPKYLKVLAGLKLIRRAKPVTSNFREKHYIYEIDDNYFRFWLSFVYPYRDEIETDPEAALSAIKSRYSDYMGKIFEGFVERSLRNITGMEFSSVGRWWHKDKEIDVVGINDAKKEIFFVECKWQDGVDASRILDELEKKAEGVEWNKGKRAEKYAVFARSFSRRSKKHLCFDLNDIEKALWGK